MILDRFQVEETKRRYHERQRQREYNQRLIREGRFLSVDSQERVAKFLARRGFSEQETRVLLQFEGRGVPRAEVREYAGVPDPLERVLGTNNMMSVAFLERGMEVAPTVGRVWVQVAAGQPAGFGTGFLISPRLLMTNHHVLADRAAARASLVEFNYQRKASGELVASTTFAFDPDTFFFADRRLDYAVVAVQETAANAKSLGEFGWNPLIEDQGKAIIAQWLNIIQHPNGEPKQLALRENQLLDVLDDFLHYEADTAPGSSGSPVFNDRWEVVALHHSGVWKTNAAGQILSVDDRVWTEDMGEDRIKWIANEGVRISKICAHLRTQPLTDEQKRMLAETSTPPAPPGGSAGHGEAGPAVVSSSGGIRVVVGADGTATWTVPLSVSVRLGVPAPAAAIQPAAAAPPRAPQPAAGVVGGDPEAILAAARRELGARADVTGVRLGYVFKNRWITKERALVVTVRQKHTPAALREGGIAPLPDTFCGLPVEVTNPAVEDLVRLAGGPAASEAAFPRLSPLKEEITYFPPASVPLNPVTDTMRVVAHVSPDAGWTQLKNFLAATRTRLVVGMYDFGAPHIADAVEQAGSQAGFQEFTLVMQRGESVGSGTKANDLTDDAVVEKLRDALGSKFANAWVKMGPVNGWVASSYHIKVAVRDRKAFWLSSGNWQSSNQPDADPLAEHPPHRKWLSEYNREWHAIVEHAGLAQTYEAYLLHDFDQNRGFQPEVVTLPDLLVPETFFLPTAEERAAPFQYFPPFEDNRQFTVQPLLTPDNYHAAVLQLVESAQEELFIQNQTFNAPGESHHRLRELVEAVREKQRAGVKVRIIFRVLFAPKARQVLEQLQDFGLNPDDIKVQKGCHTKGIVVDRKRVLLGSQNWSNDGVSVNRDASLMFDDEPLAKYFAGIFEHDWSGLAKQDIGFEALPIEAASAYDPLRRGMVRLTWKDYLEML